MTVFAVYLYLEEVGVTESRTEAEDEIALWMFGYGLHDGAIDDGVSGDGLGAKRRDAEAHEHILDQLVVVFDGRQAHAGIPGNLGVVEHLA